MRARRIRGTRHTPPSRCARQSTRTNLIVTGATLAPNGVPTCVKVEGVALSLVGEHTRRAVRHGRRILRHQCLHCDDVVATHLERAGLAGERAPDRAQFVRGSRLIPATGIAREPLRRTRGQSAVERVSALR